MGEFTRKICYNEINPYLRYARRSSYVPVCDWLCAVDYHFYFLFSSECKLELENQKYLLKSGTVVIIPPGVKYCFKSESAVDIVSINFDYTQFNAHIAGPFFPIAAEKFNKEEIIEKIVFIENEFLNNPVILDNLNYLEALVKNIVTEYNYKKQFYKETASGLFKQLLAEIMRGIIEENKNAEKINAVLKYIYNHCCEEINNQKVAEIACYHSYYLNRLIKKTVGMTIKQCIIDCRIKTAKEYLKETDLSIMEISERCGYKNFSNFSCEFKRKCGISPSKYRSEAKYLL